MIFIRNGGSIPLRDIPVFPAAEFRKAVLESVARGGRVVSFFGVPEDGAVRLLAVMATTSGTLAAVSTTVSDSYPALTPDCPQVHLFEREIHEQTGVVPQGHPWLKPVRRRDGEVGIPDMYRVAGSEVHEVAVGPIHAGVIEPGHFRFQCHGERVMHLEICLGYQHRGVERALIGGPDKRTIHAMETLAGDTTIGHATAYAMTIEALAGVEPSVHADTLRAVALELERMANHVGDLGALAGDVGYLPTSSYCGRLRGDILNLTAVICGNRFGRGVVRPGGVGCDVDAARGKQMAERLVEIFRDVESAVNLLWESPSVMERFEGTGTVSPQTCRELGLVGPVARACGVEQDVRLDDPFGLFRFAQIPIATWPTGDVLARAQVRWLEVQRSAAFVLDLLRAFPEGAACIPCGALVGESLAVSLVEGWRGEICHVAITDERQRLRAYKVVDPSFHNWMGLAMALREEQISDFPVCNKSFNLSYCGHDL